MGIKDFFENYGCLTFLIIFAVFYNIFWGTSDIEINEKELKYEQTIEELEQENYQLKELYCDLTQYKNIECVKYKEDKEEKERLLKENEYLGFKAE